MTEYPQYILLPFEGLTKYCIEILFPDSPQKPSLFQCLPIINFWYITWAIREGVDRECGNGGVGTAAF